MLYKLIFQFDDYKGSAVVNLPYAMTLKELQDDSQLSNYMDAAINKHDLRYRSFETQHGKRFQLILNKGKDAQMTIEGSVIFLGGHLVTQELLNDGDNEMPKFSNKDQLSLF